MHRVVRAVVAAIVAAGALVLPTASSDAAVPAGCTLSPPLFTNPFGRDRSGAYAALTSFQHGAWAGYASDSFGVMKVISWKPGRRPTVLAVRRFGGVEYFERSSVLPVGITPAGAVVANMQDDRTRRNRAYAYIAGHHVQLRVLSAWRSVHVLAVTEDGRILGYGNLSHRAQHPRDQLAVWRGIHAAPRVLRTIEPIAYTPLVADRRGDFAWSTSNTGNGASLVRLASGSIRTLDVGSPNREGTVEAGSGPFLFAQVAGVAPIRLMRWNTTRRSDPLRGQVLARMSADDQVIAAGAGGASVFGWTHGLRYSSGTAPAVALPGPMQTADGPLIPAIGPRGEVAFTRARDRLVHLLTCR